MSELEVRRLQDRLALSEDLVLRLQRKIMDILRLPVAQQERLRERMQQADIAVPLLQCYDASITERDEELVKLREEIVQLRQRLQQHQQESQTTLSKVRLDHEMAVTVAQQREDDAREATRRIEHLQSELTSLRERCASAVDAETKLKQAVDRLNRENAAWEQRVQQLHGANEALANDNERLTAQLSKIRSSDEEDRNTAEVNKVQLQLADKESHDKLQEIERLRAKMLTALKQSSDNHSKHLQLVEKRHSAEIDRLHDEYRLQEATIHKLKAQLTRAELPTSMSSPTDPTSLLEQQARQVHEVELRRLAAEVLSLQAQKDDALFRLEQAQSSRRLEADERFRELRKDVEIAKLRHSELQNRLMTVEGEMSVTQNALKAAQDSLATAAGELHRTRMDRDAARAQVDEMRHAASRMEVQCENLRREASASVELERAHVKQMERRIEERHATEQQLRAALGAAQTQHDSRVDELNQQIRSANDKNRGLLQQLAETQRQVETVTARSDKLQQAIHAHRREISNLEEKLAQLTSIQAQQRNELREAATQQEQLRFELMRAGRERDRLLTEATAKRRY